MSRRLLVAFSLLVESTQLLWDFHWYFRVLYGPGHAKTCLMPYANNKDADQPAHPASLINTFAVRCLDSICYIQNVKILASFCGWAGWLESDLVDNPRRHIFAWCGSYEKWKGLQGMSQSNIVALLWRHEEDSGAGGTHTWAASRENLSSGFSTR